MPLNTPSPRLDGLRRLVGKLLAFAEAMEWRPEDYQDARIARLELRLATLERGFGAPDSAS